MRFLAAAAALLLFAGPALADPPQIAISLKDQQWIPSEVPVPANTKVELLVKNEGTTPAEFESTRLHREKIVTPGRQISVFVGPLAPGSYEFFNDFHPQTRGHLIVK